MESQLSLEVFLLFLGKIVLPPLVGIRSSHFIFSRVYKALRKYASESSFGFISSRHTGSLTLKLSCTIPHTGTLGLLPVNCHCTTTGNRHCNSLRCNKNITRYYIIEITMHENSRSIFSHKAFIFGLIKPHCTCCNLK